VRMRAAALNRAEVVRELTALRSTVSSVVELVLGLSPNETSRVEFMNELTAIFLEVGGVMLMA
jgi:hypothetical protein